jgi:hypothetical protein
MQNGLWKYTPFFISDAATDYFVSAVQSFAFRRRSALAI